jgi:small nuclear ribonucleoprotein (snRNP)-like protein
VEVGEEEEEEDLGLMVCLMEGANVVAELLLVLVTEVLEVWRIIILNNISAMFYVKNKTPPPSLTTMMTMITLRIMEMKVSRVIVKKRKTKKKMTKLQKFDDQFNAVVLRVHHHLMLLRNLITFLQKKTGIHLICIRAGHGNASSRL